MATLELSNGYYDLPPGKLVNVVTCLEMTARPSRGLSTLPSTHRLERFRGTDIDAHRELFRTVGAEWLWFSRLGMPDERLAAILASDDVLSFALKAGTESFGLLELDYRVAGEAELSFFGLTRAATGKGLGRALMDEGLAMAWARPIRRLWVHTCTLDSPEALPFYVRSGFTPYKRMIEVHDDPRVTGALPSTAAPAIPLLR